MAVNENQLRREILQDLEQSLDMYGVTAGESNEHSQAFARGQVRHANRYCPAPAALRRSCLAALLLFLLAACGGPPAPPPAPANTPPTISGTPEESVRAGSEYVFTPQASDPDGDSLEFTIENQPWWAQFDSATGTLSGIPLSSHLGEYADIVISVSDGEATPSLPPFTLTVLPQLLTDANFIAEGVTTPTDNGYHVDGDLVLDTGERRMRFEDADLLLEFDENGILIEFSGEALLPQHSIDNVTIDGRVRAFVELMTGEEINADETFGILLQEETRYLVFLLDAGVDLTMHNPNDAGIFETITLDLPVDGQILLISDPTDPFLYRFAAQALIGERGYGQSYNGLIPFEPQLEHPALLSFNGHELEKGAFDIGFKVFDFYRVSGTRVIRNPDFLVIDWDDPFQPTFDYAAGMNGDLDFAFSVLGVGLFSFEHSRASATTEVTPAESHLAMQTRTAPDVSWVPDWFPFVPATETVGEWAVFSDGEFTASLSGRYQSTVPPADVAGTISIDNDAALLSGTVADEAGELTLSAEFMHEVTTLRIDPPASFEADVDEIVLETLDRELEARADALAALEAATEDYEFEVSLRGLRPLLPGIADTVISELNRVPGLVYTAVYNATVNYIRNACVTVLVTVCLSTLVDEEELARTTGTQARNQAANRIVPYVAAMQELKTQAQNDDEALREALRLALLGAWNNQVFSERFVISYTFPDPFGTVTVYDSTYTRRVIPTEQADQIRDAADNVHLIGETSGIMISAQAVFDAFPSEETFATVRQEVGDGLAEIPAIEAIGATIAGGVIDAFVTVGGTDYPVAFNVLSPSETEVGLGDLVTGLLLDRAQ